MSRTDWPFPGSRWWKFDFHTHTPASSDYGAGPNQVSLKGRTYREWLSDYISAGIECVAVTDHNCGDWIDPLKAELEKMRAEKIPGAAGLYLFAGVELTINGAHFLAIFDPSATTRKIQDLLAVARCNNSEKNAEAYCSESVGAICDKVHRLGGLFIPAHVDEPNTGAFKLQGNHSALDPILKLEGVLAMEVRDKNETPPAAYRDAKLKWTSVIGSDAHHPSAPPTGFSSSWAYPGARFTWVKMATPSIEALRLALLDGANVSIRRSDDTTPGFNPDQVPEDLIEEISIRDARYMGRGSSGAQTLRFSPWLNALVGGRGSGKSTVVQFLRLVLRREQEILSIPGESQPRLEFERFRKVSRNRDDDGAIKSETLIQLIYRHHGGRFRISWPDKENEKGVEEWNAESKEWQIASSQEVRDRFPIRLLSQGEIATLAGERTGALLGLINKAVDYSEWKSRWDEKERAFLVTRSRIRELEAKFKSRDRIVGQLEDVRRKLASFEEAEHAKVLKAYQSRRRQSKEVEQQSVEARTAAQRINALAGEIQASDVPEGLFVAEDPLSIEAFDSINRIRAAITNAASAVRIAGAELVRVIEIEASKLENGQWKADGYATKLTYDKLVVELQAQGVQDPSEYGRLVQDRQRFEGEVKAMDSLAETLVAVRGECDEIWGELQSLRRLISEKRVTFLQQTLSNNLYVRIELNRYGRESIAARDSLRAVLGIDQDPNQFESDIFRSDETGGEQDQGVIAKLLADLPEENAVGEIEQRLHVLRAGFVAAATGGDFAQIGGRLKTRLQRSMEQRPEFVDRILTWFPEDSLSVSYSPRGDGKEFRPITHGSAGQRAAAMLAFLLAYGDEPIVVDQPEDDLDNHLIYELVVRQMRANKQRRQIITVTHNPNIVVNGDAEMVHALDFVKGQCAVTHRGSLQDASVRSEICRVMEGGEEAFEQRYRRIGKGGRNV